MNDADDIGKMLEELKRALEVGMYVPTISIHTSRLKILLCKLSIKAARQSLFSFNMVDDNTHGDITQYVGVWKDKLSKK